MSGLLDHADSDESGPYLVPNPWWGPRKVSCYTFTLFISPSLFAPPLSLFFSDFFVTHTLSEGILTYRDNRLNRLPLSDLLLKYKTHTSVTRTLP